MPKIVLVTGTSSGLGISIAIQAAQAGHIVYASMRDVEKRAALDTAATQAGVTLKVLPLDVQDTVTVMAAVDRIHDEQGRVDVLINNAGAGFVRSTEQASEAGIQWVMDVNFMGVVRCTKALMPHMRQTRSGHVITVSSVGGLVGQPFNEIYCAAKFAVEGFTESLASYFTPHFGIHFTTVAPGGVSSDFAANVMKQVQDTGGMLEDKYLAKMCWWLADPADEVATIVMACMHAEEPPIRKRTSEWSDSFAGLKTDLDPAGKKLQASVIKQFLS